jgi:hypothetical protein
MSAPRPGEVQASRARLRAHLIAPARSAKLRTRKTRVAASLDAP